MQMNPQYEQIGKAFVEHYYQMFQTNRAALVSLYQADSLMSFEGGQAQGAAAIGAKHEVPVLLLHFNTTLLTYHRRALDSKLLRLNSQLLTASRVVTEAFSSLSLVRSGYVTAATTNAVHLLLFIKADEDPVQGFSQGFILAPTPSGSFYIQNDCFRLNIHNT